jgi:purine-nucleoside phosphorylase
MRVGNSLRKIPPSFSDLTFAQIESEPPVPTLYPLKAVDEATAFIVEQCACRPKVGLVLGSGLSGLADAVTQAAVISYEDIPHFPLSTAPGHAGRLVVGVLGNVPVCVMQGRFHFYEGYGLPQVTFPIRVMHRMGIRTMILTNAAGGINVDFQVGDLMLIEDHINFVGMSGHNPLMGPNADEFGPRFPAANHMYSKELRQLAQSVAAQHGFEIQSGVYTYLSGPSFETPAEVRMLRVLGADAVGMSTVPEAQVARHAGMDVLAVSTITNLAIDALDAMAEPTHDEVQAAGALIVPKLTQLLLGIITQLANRAS